MSAFIRPPFHLLAKFLLILIFLGLPLASRATDTYSPGTGVLTIPSVLVGTTTYLNVEVTVGNILGVGGVLPGTVTVPLLTAIQNNVTNGYSKTFTISGYDNTPATPITGSGSLTVGGATSTILNGVPYLKEVEILSASLIVNGSTTPINAVAAGYINPSTFATVIVDETNPYFILPAYTIPASVVAGQTGIYGTATEYSSSSKTTVIGTVVGSYEILSDSSTSLLYKSISDFYDTSYNHTVQSAILYRVTTSGAITPLSSTVLSFSVNGSIPLTYTFTYQ
jgi:hypothetical protein